MTTTHTETNPTGCHSSLNDNPALEQSEQSDCGPLATICWPSLLLDVQPDPGPPSYLGPEGAPSLGNALARVHAHKVGTELTPCPTFGLAWAVQPAEWASEVKKSLHALKNTYAHVTDSIRDAAVAVSLTGGTEDAAFLLAATCMLHGAHALLSFGGHPPWRRPSPDHRPHVHGIFIGDADTLFEEWSEITGESVLVQQAKPFSSPGWESGWLKYCAQQHDSEYVIGAGMFAPIVACTFGLCAACGRKLDQPCRRDKTYCSAKCRQRDCRGRKRV